MTKLTILAALFAACTTTTDQPPYDLHIDGGGMTPGANLHIAVLELDGNPIIQNEWSPVERADVAITYSNLLAKGVGYRVYVFEDRDNNGLCNFADRIWETVVPPATGEATVDVGTLEQSPESCSYFSSP